MISFSNKNELSPFARINTKKQATFLVKRCHTSVVAKLNSSSYTSVSFLARASVIQQKLLEVNYEMGNTKLH
jgi:hypothetical protein